MTLPREKEEFHLSRTPRPEGGACETSPPPPSTVGVNQPQQVVHAGVRELPWFARLGVWHASCKGGEESLRLVKPERNKGNGRVFQTAISAGCGGKSGVWRLTSQPRCRCFQGSRSLRVAAAVLCGLPVLVQENAFPDEGFGLLARSGKGRLQ